MQEDARRSGEQLYISRILESRQLRENDGISPTVVDIHSNGYLSDPITGLNSHSARYSALSEDMRTSIDLRVQKYAVVQLARRLMPRQPQDGETNSEQELNRSFSQSRKLLTEFSERMYAEMDRRHLEYEFKNPITGKELPRNSLILLLFYRSYLIHRPTDKQHSNEKLLKKCQDFYQKNQAVIPPEPIDRFNTQLYLENTDTTSLLEETLYQMQTSLVNAVQELIIDTHQYTGYFAEDVQELSYLSKSGRQAGRNVAWIPTTAQHFIEYYEDKGYSLPHGQDDVPNNDVTNSIIIMRDCAKAVHEEDEGKKHDLDRRIRRKMNKYDKIRESNLHSEAPTVSDSQRHQPVQVVEHDTVGHRLLIERYGMVFGETIRRWTIASRIPVVDDDDRLKQYYSSKIIKKNLEMMQEMELLRPGISRALYDNFGIINYSRYPTDTLIDQFDHMNDVDIKYGIALFAAEDYNGVFLVKPGVWKDFHTSLQKSNQHLRIIEAENKSELLAKRMFFLRTHYRPKISFGAVSAHGNKKGFELSSPVSGRIDSEDFDSEIAKMILQFFEPDAPLVLASCSTGSFEGLAHNISVNRNGIVSGPGGIDKIQGILWNNGNLDVRFEVGQAMRYKNGIIFRN